MSEAPLEIAVSDVHRRRLSGDAFPLIDCREPDEYAIARIEGAKLIPMGEIPDRLAELDAWRDQPLVVHCHHGGRSLRVVRWLRQQGFSQAMSMAGGIDDWSKTIDPAVPRY